VSAAPTRGPTESVVVRVAPGRRVVIADGVVTKEFRHTDLRAKWRDRHRARQEGRVLRTLAERGVRVPRWLATERLADGGWAVSLEEVPGARTVSAALTEQSSNASLGALLARAGELLASLHAAGLDQPDLHAGNALVDTAGSLWAIDFHAAELQDDLGLGILSRDLVKLCSAHRETLPLRTRQRFFLAWWRALASHLRDLLPERSDFAAEVEERGRRARIATCQGYAKPSSRYFRKSATMRAVNQGDGAHLLARAGAPESHVRAALDVLGGKREDPRLLHVDGDRSKVEAAWGRAARLASHGLPGARPLLLDRRDAAHCHALFDWESAAGTVPLIRPGSTTLGPMPITPPLPPTRAAGLDEALSFRGLALRAASAEHFRTVDQAVLLAPEAELVTRDELARRRVKKRRRRSRRARILARWPRLCQPPWLPIARSTAGLAARALRFTPLERRIRSNLATALPEAAVQTAAIRRHMAHLAVEWGRMSAPDFSAELLGRVRPDASLARHRERLEEGAIIITPHLGNWEWLAAYLVHHGREPGTGYVGAVVGRLRRRDPLAAFQKAQRARAGVETLPQDTHPRELVRRLARGEIVGLLPDVEVSRLAGARMPFLGREALVMTAPAALARAAKRPLLPAACLRQPDGTYTLTIADPIAPPTDKPSTLAVTRAWVAVFEDWIRAHPEQWLWAHDRWRSDPTAADTMPLSALRQAQR